MSESVILCEGFHDRAFWAGWLEHLGCGDPGAAEAGQARRKRVLDPFGTPVEGGQFAFETSGGAFIRVVPCGGKEKVPVAARVRLLQRTSKAIIRLVINVDSDRPFDDTGTHSRATDRVDQVVRECDPSATRHESGDWLLDGNRSTVSLIEWQSQDRVSEGVPAAQTLERLVCSAIVSAYPQRAPCVQAWLDSRPEPPIASPKEYAWSYMAGWHAECGCEHFFRSAWTDIRVAEALRSRLVQSGGWRIAESLVAGI